MEQDSRPSKRVKLDESDHAIFEDPTLQRQASDICNEGSAGIGFLSGTVFMAWAPQPGSAKLQAILETREESDYGAQRSHRFYIEFSGGCIQFFSHLILRALDEISLSLKGAQVEKTVGLSRACTLEMKLVYMEGVVLMIRKRASGLDGASKIVDTWKLSNVQWFNSPEPQEELQEDEPLYEDAAEKSENPDAPDSPDAMIQELNEKPSDACIVSSRQSSVPTGTIASTLPQQMETGLQTAMHKYHPLGAVSVGQDLNIIGVVVSIPSPSRTRNGDWFINVKMVDPSSQAKPGMVDPEALSVNCFTKQHASWLPQPLVGDALMLRRIQIQLVQGHMKGIGYHGRFQWAIYSPRRKNVLHGDFGRSQIHEAQSNDNFACWTPFFEPCPSEINYCVTLSEWWQSSENKQNREVDHVDLTQTPFSSYQLRRLHRLIKDTGPEVQPNGYFDCTIEVVHGYINDNEVYSLFVTDYTKNDLVTPIHLDWCPDGLADYILKMEMWDAAAKIGPTMEPGAYYSISNARIRVSKGGHVEAKLVLPKIVKLNEEDADTNPHLRNLLQRKESWSKQHGPALEIEDKLIQDAVEGQFFNCVIEVLHVSDNGYGSPSIYVTDYTKNSYLDASQVKEQWCKGLEGRVLKISLWDCHIPIAKSITPGFYYSIKKLRLRGDYFEGDLRGRERLIHQLNSNRPNDQLRLLIKRKEDFLQDGDVGEACELSAMLNNKRNPTTTTSRTLTPNKPDQTPSSEGEKRYTWSPSPPPGPKRMESLSPLAMKSRQVHEPIKFDILAMQQYTSLNEMMNDNTCPKKFLVRSRVIDFYPMSLKDCSQQWCGQCKKQISSKFKACIACSDIEHEFVTHRYQVFLMLEDDGGIRTVVSAYDKSHLFDGLERASFTENTKAYDNFCARLSPLLGNLVQVHDDGLRGIETPTKTETYDLEIVSWEGPDGERAFGLFSCLKNQ